MPKYIIEMERTQFFAVEIEAVNDDAARRYADQVRPGYHPFHSDAELRSVIEDDDDGWMVTVKDNEECVI